MRGPDITIDSSTVTGNTRRTSPSDCRAVHATIVDLGGVADSDHACTRTQPSAFVGGVVQDRGIGCRMERETAVSITNQQVTEHAFLQGLYADDYFPDQVVDKGKAILLRLCERIEAERPSDLAALYVLTGSATEEFNALEAEFEAAGSEIETVAREEIAEDFGFVASAYGFEEADVEKLIAARDW